MPYYDAITKRLPVIAQLLLANEILTESDCRWLKARVHHNDWHWPDYTRLREMLPASMRWLLEYNDPDELTSFQEDATPWWLA